MRRDWELGCTPTYPGFSQQRKQLTTLDKVHDHVEVLPVLKGTPEGDEERVLDVAEHAALVVGVLDLLHLDDLGLFQDLDGVESLVVLGLDEVNSAETTGAESSEDIKVGQGVFALCNAGADRGLGHVVRLVGRLLGLLGLLVERSLMLLLLHGAGDRMSLLLLLSEALGIGAGALAGGMEVLRDEVCRIVLIGIALGVLVGGGSVVLLLVH